jgi:hypothetical protein
MLNKLNKNRKELTEAIVELVEDVADTNIGEIKVGTVIYLGMWYIAATTLVEAVKLLTEDSS